MTHIRLFLRVTKFDMSLKAEVVSSRAYIFFKVENVRINLNLNLARLARIKLFNPPIYTLGITDLLSFSGAGASLGISCQIFSFFRDKSPVIPQFCVRP